MSRPTIGLLALILLTLPLAATAQEAPQARARVGDRLDPADYGPGIIESMEAAVARDLERRASAALSPAPEAAKRGEWAVPSPGAAEHPHSGTHYVVNKYGATDMGVGFPTVMDVHGAYFAGQGGRGVWATAIRVYGYRDGVEVAATDWFTDLGAEPAWFPMNLTGVDCITIEAAPVYGGAAWYAMDDFTFSPSGADYQIVLDFEDTRFKQVLTGTDYASLSWETGSEGFRPQPDIVDAPRHAGSIGDAAAPDQGGGYSTRGLGTLPQLLSDFQGVIRGDAGSSSAPPDTCGAIGPDHFVITVNRNFAVYDRTNGAELINMHLGSFLPGSNGDPRVLYDQHSGRWIVLVTDFDTKIFLAVSLTSDATGSWFKTDFVVTQGSDAGTFPDYPTLGVDASGIYTAAYMVGNGTMSIFAIDKAPLVAPSPSLGTVTAFRLLPWEGAIQPVQTYGTPPGEYLVSTQSSTQIRLRRLDGPMTSPTLNELGAASIPSYGEPPDAPVQGSSTPLDTVGSRLMNAVYRDGSVYTAHCIAGGAGAMSRWYQISTASVTLTQSGDVSDPLLYYFFPSIAVNAAGDLALGISGSYVGQYAAAYYTGRLASDPPGEMADPALLRQGDASHNIIDSYGRNRFGDYSLTTLDPTDEMTIWTIQEYVHATDTWGTWVAELSPVLPALFVSLPSGAPSLLSPGTPESFDVQVTAGSQLIVPGSPTLHYRYAGGSFQTAPLTNVSGDLYEATLPAPGCDDTPEFYVSASGDGGVTVTSPSDAPASYYSATVGTLTVVMQDDFETDTGWTVENDGALTDGAWDRGIPVGGGDRGDPPTDYDGSDQCYLTDNVDDNSDVDGGTTWLISPTIDLSDADADVQYALWYTNNFGGDPNNDLFKTYVSNNDGGSWTLVETIGPASPSGWNLHAFTVSDFVTPTALVKVRFEASDLGSGSVVEAGIDAFTVQRFGCENPCTGDLDGDNDIDIGDLATLLGNYGMTSGATYEDGDLDGDGDVDITDLATLLGVYGTSC